MPDIKESKHERFLRLMQKRLGRTLEEARLVGQLSSDNYENNPTEAEEVVKHLDASVHDIAKKFEIPYSTAIGAAAQRAAASKHLVTTSAKAGRIDEVDIAKAIGHIDAGHLDAAKQLLKSALLQEVR